MPYIPSEKTDEFSQERIILDLPIDILAKKIAKRVQDNLELRTEYIYAFEIISARLTSLIWQHKKDTYSRKPHFIAVVIDENTEELVNAARSLAQTIHEISTQYAYEGAHLGLLNYSVTRLIQRVPQIKVERGEWKEEMRYWVYALTVDALNHMHYAAVNSSFGLSGVFEDVKDEYKRRTNVAYEAAQIIKSGDCYNTPYYTRLVEVVDEEGKHIGYQEVMLKRSDETVNRDILEQKVVLHSKK